MKNLFKNLMLVAVAAMAFTACSQDVNEVNNVERTVRYEFTANFADDTRSGFAEETSTNDIGKTVYHSEWFGNETLFLVPNVGESTTAPISAEGKFSVDLSSDATQIDIYSPASSWSDYGSYRLANVPAEQTSGVNSVDPKAHIVSGYAMVDANGNQTIPVTLNHAVAYGKMTVSGVDFAIDHVVVDLKGSFSSYDRECSYTIKANGVDNTFWFATEPIDVAEFAVTAYDAVGNAVTKTIDVAALENKTLSFNCGRVSTFSVSGLEAPAVPMFTSAYISGSMYSDFYIYFDDSNGVLSNLKFNLGGMCDPDWILSTGEWKLGAYPGIYVNPEWKYSSYGNVALATGTVKIDIIDKKYHFEFINLADYNGNVLIDYATYVGSVEGLNVPDPRTQLATPNATATVDGKMVTISWDEVVGADSYKVTSDIYSSETNEKSVTFEAPEYSKTYYVSVVAVALDSNPTYKSSGACELVISTDRDPDVVVPEFTTIKYLRQEVTYASYNEYCHVFELTNSDNYKMELYVGSYQSSSTHIAEGSYHYEGKSNLGYSQTQWGFQSKVWTTDGYLGSAYSDSSMIVKKSGDIYNINFTLIIDGQTYFFDCNAAIGGNEPEPEPEPEPDPTPDPDPDQPGDIVVPDGHILLNTCEYITEISGMLRQYRFATNDGNNIFYVFVKKDNTHGAYYIGTKTYSNGGTNDVVGSMSKFNMDCTYGSSISDTKIDGVGYANGVSTSSSNTMEVKSAIENGIHEIVFKVKGKAYYFYGTIQE